MYSNRPKQCSTLLTTAKSLNIDSAISGEVTQFARASPAIVAPMRTVPCTHDSYHKLFLTKRFSTKESQSDHSQNFSAEAKEKLLLTMEYQLDDSSNDQHSVASGGSTFQVQLMRCGFLPQNSVSSFDLKDLSDLELKDEDGANQDEDRSEMTASTRTSDSRGRSVSPKPTHAPRRGLLRATLSFRLSRRGLIDELHSEDVEPQQPESSSGCNARNQGLRTSKESGKRTLRDGHFTPEKEEDYLASVSCAHRSIEHILP